MQVVKLKTPRISEYTVRRLSVYHRILDNIEQQGTEVVSSATLAELAGTNSAQIRKDLSYFGNFGKRGRGYQVSALKEQIKAILGLDRPWRVVLAGAGNLGHALCSYRDFQRYGFDIVAVFDVDPKKVGTEWEGTPIRHLDECNEVIGQTRAELAIIATPGQAAQQVVDRLRQAGVRGFLNFAPQKIEPGERTNLRNVDITIELEGLTYALNSSRD